MYFPFLNVSAILLCSFLIHFSVIVLVNSLVFLIYIHFHARSITACALIPFRVCISINSLMHVLVFLFIIAFCCFERVSPCRWRPGGVPIVIAIRHCNQLTFEPSYVTCLLFPFFNEFLGSFAWIFSCALNSLHSKLWSHVFAAHGSRSVFVLLSLFRPGYCRLTPSRHVIF